MNQEEEQSYVIHELAEIEDLDTSTVHQWELEPLVMKEGSYGLHAFNIRLSCGCIAQVAFPRQRDHTKPMVFEAKIIKKCKNLQNSKHQLKEP